MVYFQNKKSHFALDVSYKAKSVKVIACKPLKICPIFLFDLIQITIKIYSIVGSSRNAVAFHDWYFDKKDMIN